MQLSLFLIIFILQFHSALAIPMDGWQLMDVVRTAIHSGQSNGIGYECGNDFFSSSEIKEALSKYQQYMNHKIHSPLKNRAPQGYSDVQQLPNVPQENKILQKYNDFDILQYYNLLEFDSLENKISQGHQNIQQHFTPEIYEGPLYRDSESSNYILWPIQKEQIIHSSSKYYSDSYYIVIKKNSGEVIDVISKIIDNDFAKCIRKDGSRTELSTSAPDMNNGYKCGHKFLSDELIQTSLRLAWDTIGKSNQYPISYVGRLYPANSGYMIWPIFSGNKLYDYSSVEAGPYFLVIDMLGNPIEIVVQGLANNFLRCTRSRRSSRRSSRRPASKEPDHSSASTPDMQSGYYCDMIFFSENAIYDAVNAARITKKAKIYTKFPLKYDGPPFNEPLLLWPIMTNGLLFEKGSPGLHRVLLTEDFGIKGIGIKQGSSIRLCEVGIWSEVKNHEKSDFYCLDHVVHNRDLENAAKNACIFSPKKKDRFYPAKYMGPNFEKRGPYFTYPVLEGSNFLYRTGPDRVVINPNCEVVGALTYYPKPTGNNRANTFVMCVKFQERTKTKTYIQHNMPIYEHQWRYSTP